MDAEAIVWLIFIAIWFISGVVRQIKQVSDQRPGQEGQPRPAQEAREQQVPDDDPMVQLLRKLGGEFEVRPQEPPRETRPQPQVRTQTPSPPPAPPAQVRAQRPAVAIDRSRPAKVARRSRVVELPAVPEVPKMPLVVPAVSRGGGPPSALARSLRRDLREPDSIRKAILLQEILGKPPGLQGLRG